MNNRFFELPKEKQDRFINAALQIFAKNGYKKASTDEIVKAAGISKGLLFHYFGSKQGLYEFVYMYSVKYISMEYSRTVPLFSIDFFSLQRKVEEAKRDIIRNYPYMNLFVTLAFREEKEILTLIADSMDQYSTMLSGIYQKADLSCFKTGIDASAVLKMCLFVADGVLNEQFRNDSIDAESYITEVESYLQLLEENMCW